mmetsp:Transcript_44499/g.105465  ORF Transcript_44499/g.105465 Transcript_44499/m.105465 type:complete len:215 (+) Transcript_44499:54-698(+)
MVRLVSSEGAATRDRDEEAADVVSEKLRKYRKRKNTWTRRLWKYRLLLGLAGAALITLVYVRARPNSRAEAGGAQPLRKSSQPVLDEAEPVQVHRLSSLRGGGGDRKQMSGATAGGGEAGEIAAISYEVHGKVQGVFFRKHTKRVADSLGVVGWVMNTKQGTVTGEAQGAPEQVAAMENWLGTEGSPKSVIQRLEVSKRRTLPAPSFSSFSIRK